MVEYICDVCKKRVPETVFCRHFIEVGTKYVTAYKTYGKCGHIDVCVDCKKKIEKDNVKYINAICEALRNTDENV